MIYQMGMSKLSIPMQMVRWTLSAIADDKSNASDGYGNDDVTWLIDEYAEEDMGQEFYQREHSEVQPRAPSGQIKGKRIRDSSELMQNTINYQAKEDKIPEDHAIHWQEQEILDLCAIASVMERQKQERMRRQEQAQLDVIVFNNNKTGFFSRNASFFSKLFLGFRV